MGCALDGLKPPACLPLGCHVPSSVVKYAVRPACQSMLCFHLRISGGRCSLVRGLCDVNTCFIGTCRSCLAKAYMACEDVCMSFRKSLDRVAMRDDACHCAGRLQTMLHACLASTDACLSCAEHQAPVPLQSFLSTVTTDPGALRSARITGDTTPDADARPSMFSASGTVINDAYFSPSASAGAFLLHAASFPVSSSCRLSTCRVPAIVQGVA